MKYLQYDTAAEAEEARKKLQEQADAAYAADPGKPHVFHVPFLHEGKQTQTVVDETPAKVAKVQGRGKLLTREELQPVAIKEAPMEEMLEP